MLTKEYFEIYERHLKESEHLYLRPRMLHAGNALVPAFNLTTVDLIVPEEPKKKGTVGSVALQVLGGVLWTMFVGILGLGFLALGSLVVSIDLVSALVRTVKSCWA